MEIVLDGDFEGYVFKLKGEGIHIEMAKGVSIKMPEGFKGSLFKLED